MMRILAVRTTFFMAVAVTFVMGLSREVHADVYTSLALGDSLAFGVGADDSAADISNGDRGYVGPFATILGSFQGGVRPKLINLGISGETSDSFYQIGTGLNGPGAIIRNTNYVAPYVSQNDTMLAAITAEKAAGRTISAVTVQLGANDLYKVAGAPGFFSLPAAQQQALIVAALGVLQVNDTKLLTELHNLLPSAKVILMGYYDPYAPFIGDSTSPFFPIAQASHLAIPALNQVIQGEAAAFGGVYVDTSTPFAGHELQYTYVASGNSHPNLLGYQVITNQITLAAVPEPGPITLALVGSVVVGLTGVVRRSRRLAA